MAPDIRADAVDGACLGDRPPRDVGDAAPGRELDNEVLHRQQNVLARAGHDMLPSTRSGNRQALKWPGRDFAQSRVGGAAFRLHEAAAQPGGGTVDQVDMDMADATAGSTTPASV
jgi:hypothetical protein